MAIQSAAEWKKKKQQQQAATPTPTPTPQGEQGGNFSDFLGEKLSFLEEPEQFRRESIFPEDYGEGVLPWIGENIFNPIAQPLEQFARTIPAVGYEGARAINVGLNPTDPRNQSENPFVPGLEQSSQGDIAKMMALRTGKAMVDLLTLGKGGALAKGGKGLLAKAGEGALLGGAFPATQREAPTPEQMGISAGAGAILAPAAGVVMSQASKLARRLLGKAPQEVIDDMTTQVIGENASIKTRTPFEIAQESDTVGTDLLESMVGKDKTKQIQKKVIEGRFEKPQTSKPVLGKYQVEQPSFLDMPKEIQSLSNTIAPDVPNVVPEHVATSIDNVPVAKRTPGRLQVLARNLWSPVQTAVRNMGKSGEQLSKSIDDFRSSEYTMRGKMQVQIDKAFKGLKLTPEEEINFWEAAQQMAEPMNAKVSRAVEESRKFAGHFFKQNTDRGILENMVDNTGSPIIDPNKYLSHMLNDKGWQAFEFNEDKFFRKIAEHNLKPGQDIDQVMSDVINDWKFIQKAMTPKSFFERQRTWRIPPEFMERNPQKIWTRYNATASKRYALLDKFGQPMDELDDAGNRTLTYPQIKTHLMNIMQESGLDSMRYAQNAMDLIIGRHPSDFAMKKVAADLMEFQLVSKLTPLTTIPNLQQGFLSSIYRHGLKYAVRGLKDAFTQEGRDFVNKTGLIGEGFYSPSRYNKMTKAWGHITQFPFSEDFNFRVNTNSAKYFIRDMFTKLMDNPGNKAVRKHLELTGLDPDKLIEQGMLTEDDLLKGAFISGRDSIFPKLAEQVPMWANNPAGKLIYQFSHYALKQPEMLMSQFRVSKTRGVTSLLKFLAAQAALGEPVSDIWALIRQKERPEDLPSRLAENIFYSGALGVPAEIFRTLESGYSGVAGPFAGPTISGAAQAGSRIIQDLKAGEYGKAMEDAIRGRVKGDIPFPGPPIPAGSFLERLVPREKLPSKQGGSWAEGAVAQ